MFRMIAVVGFLWLINDRLAVRSDTCKPVRLFSCQIWDYSQHVTPTKEQINRALAAQVRAGMALRDMTIAELATRTGESESTINRIRAGADVQVSKIYAIASALDLDPVRMLEDALTEAQKS